MTYKFYSDRKFSVWERTIFRVDSNSKEDAINKVKQQFYEQGDEYYIDGEIHTLYETEEPMTTKENQAATLEIYDGETNEMIISNYEETPVTVIDNIELIKPLLNFSEEGDFYMLYIFKRKKDQVTDKANHQSVRTIKTYSIENIKYLEQKYDEIKQLCEVFKARAYIHIQKQNHKDVSLNMMMELAHRIQSNQLNQFNLFDSVIGQMKTYEKRWVVDIDTKDTDELNAIKLIINNSCRPLGNKIIATIPTKGGYHLITSRFDIMEFNKFYSNIDIQKKNPTLLYLPNSLT